MTIANTVNLDSYWMPFTANRQFKKAPRLLASSPRPRVPITICFALEVTQSFPQTAKAGCGFPDSDSQIG
jgi:hypothetical protein